ncbi:MAG: hypothetical protein Q9191_008384 [Dirinaria sp. TL-2023a]
MSGKDKASIRLYPVTPGSTPPPPLTDSDLSQQSSLSSSSSLLEKDSPSSTRVLVAVSLKDGFHDVDDWLQWLTTHMPTDVKNLKMIKPEGLWGAHSTLGLMSMPVAVWDLFPRNAAYYCVGYIKTPNFMSQELAPVPSEEPTGQKVDYKSSKQSKLVHAPRDSSQYPTIIRDDILIAVIGERGAGKSSFIAEASGKAVEAASGLDSKMKAVQCYSFFHQGTTVHLIDTPGFDGAMISVFDAFRDTETWLSEEYGSSLLLNGVISVHPITLTSPQTKRRLWESVEDPRTQQYKMFTLLTTKWDLFRSDVAGKREAGFKKIGFSPKQWVFHFDGTRKSALQALAPYLETVASVHDLEPIHQQDVDFKEDSYLVKLSALDPIRILTIDKKLFEIQLLISEREYGWALYLHSARFHFHIRTFKRIVEKLKQVKTSASKLSSINETGEKIHGVKLLASEIASIDELYEDLLETRPLSLGARPRSKEKIHEMKKLYKKLALLKTQLLQQTEVASSEIAPFLRNKQSSDPLPPAREALRRDEELRRDVAAAIRVLCTVM